MIYLANALHQSGPDPLHPAWDTLWALRNTGTAPVTCRIQLRRDDGTVVTWPDGQDHYDQVIEPGLMWAASFIPGNGFSAFPTDWQGAATIDCQRSGPFGPVAATADILPFFLLSFNAWHNGINAPFRKALAAATRWQLAYAIPDFDDSQGATERVWSTGILLNNQGSASATGRLIYTIAQTYPDKGQQFTIPFALGPYQKKRFDLLLGNPAQGIAGLKDVGYPDGLNSEGHLDIVTDSPVLLQPSALIADRQYDFTVTEDGA